MFRKITIGLLLLTLAFSVSAQTKRKTTKKKTTAKKAAPVKTETVAEEATATAAAATKKNARPESEATVSGKANETGKTNSRPVAKENASVYFYEFSQPTFLVSQIRIEHDENGKGKITFQKKDLSEPITDPLQLSAATLERVKTVWTALDFLDSTENYQAPRDYSNLGAMRFTMKKNGRERTAAFNWSDNKDAKSLADEYRRIGQQFIWVFDVNVARENQPLDAPRLLDALDSMVRRNEISDAAQMLPLLTELAGDERLPLIARNHAARLAAQIEKSEKKK